ncbi:lysosomal thioesterase PPT2-A-like isoform X2 [Symsagittifera roscoffensis]|uniref:lysosomal thioesterase PPT2-A-like isoform X2 n=1 Tax=Symsagittifera roscoffensis TaxID=84072 RepID=UPI00307C7245
MKNQIAPLIFFAQFWASLLGQKYRPLVLIHGVTSSYTEFDTMKKFVKEDYPEIEVFALDGNFNDDLSVLSLLEQVPGFSSLLFNITSTYGDVTLLGFSQGGIVSRGVVQMSDNDNIHTFISLSAPGFGEYGIPPDLPFPFYTKHLTKEEVYHICYRNLGQTISVCNYWTDPTEREKYLKYNYYLPPLNNELPHASAQRYKENFLKLKKLVLVGGPDDGTIIPWQSAHYTFYDKNLTVLPYYNQPTYIQDSYGLRTLNERGGVDVHMMPGVEHTQWIQNRTVYETVIKPYLV